MPPPAPPHRAENARQGPRAAARLARVLWIAWAVIVWNVVFDHVIVVAGRNYIYAAGLSAAHNGPDGRPSFARMDDWMRPAVTRGLWIASAAAAAIVLTGLAAVRMASRRDLTPGLTPRGDSR